MFSTRKIVWSSAFMRADQSARIKAELQTRFHSFMASPRDMKAPRKRVGQTGSLPGFRERSSQGKLPVCPTLAPRFSLFQRIANGERHGNRQSYCEATSAPTVARDVTD